MNYYNEIDPYCVQWLQNLMDGGLIPKGDTDDRSIEDVEPSDLDGYIQCHFFAGIAGWPLALQIAQWPSDKPCWTGSCPCQPFSASGQQGGADDSRHLWPAFYRLIAECRPATVFGEQVASKSGRGWLAAVRADLESVGYACGAADIPAAGIGAPHIRQRLWWVGDASSNGSWIRETTGQEGEESQSEWCLGSELVRPCNTDRVAYSDVGRPRSQPDFISETHGGRTSTRPFNHSTHDRVDNPIIEGLEGYSGHGHTGNQSGREHQESDGPIAQTSTWGNVDFIPCADGKSRPAQPGIRPLVDGVPGRVGQFRAYGNAIVPEVAAVFVRSYMEAVTYSTS